MTSRPAPVRIDPVPDPMDPALEPLLSEPLANAWAAGHASALLRDRLLQRAAVSKVASAAMFTSRCQRLQSIPLAPGVSMRVLYAAPVDRPLRPGEPLRACLIELQPGSSWANAGTAHHREWLVLRGRACVAGDTLDVRDYRVVPPGGAADALLSETGALLFLRESASAAGEAFTVRDAQAGWPDYAPGIRRRVLWQHAGQAALLYAAEPGASVPMHRHGHDEECLMVQGELFLDDVLLQEGDYQLAPAGTGHRVTETDTGVVIYAHGDLDLKFVEEL